MVIQFTCVECPTYHVLDIEVWNSAYPLHKKVPRRQDM